MIIINVEDIDEDGYDFGDTVDDHDDPSVTLVSLYGNLIGSMWAVRMLKVQLSGGDTSTR